LFEYIAVNFRDITKKINLVYCRDPLLYILIVFLVKIVFIGLERLAIKWLDKISCIKHKTEEYNKMGAVAVYK